MAPSQNPGTPALNPPPPGELQSLSDTATATDNYDVVIGGTGFMLWRGQDDTEPSSLYKQEPADYTYSPVFIERANVQGDLGDNAQDFYMTFTQRDWSGGLGQRYFRNTDPQKTMFWDGTNVMPTNIPGELRLGVQELTASGVATGASNRPMQQFLYYLDTRGAMNSARGYMVKFEAAFSSTTITYQHSRDGGTSWTTQGVTNDFIPTDLPDSVVGEDGFIYVLEGGAATCTIHKIDGPATSSNAWDNTTQVTGLGTTPGGANCITYWNGFLYIGSRAAKLIKVTSPGTASAGSVIRDLGGGRIVQLLATAEGIYMLYASPLGEYRVYLYNGTSVTQVYTLPTSFKSNYTVEQQADYANTSGPCQGIHAMSYQDGVLYITGLMPTESYARSDRENCPLSTVLCFYSAGNSGIIWQSDVYTHHNYEVGAGGASISCPGGMIVFSDMPALRLMAYDTGTGGIAPIGSVTDFQVQGVSTQTIAGTSNSLATSVAINGVLRTGDVIVSNSTNEKVLVLYKAAISGTNTFSVLRGYAGTTPANGTFVSGNTIATTSPMPPLGSFAYDRDNNVLFASWNVMVASIPSGSGTHPYANKYTYWKFRPGPDYSGSAYNGTVASSQFDFDSSLQKYFRSVSWDGETIQFPNRTDETAGTVDLYYKLNGVASNTTDTGVVAVQTGATPGTFYNINATGRSITILAQLNAPAGSGADPISVGPIVRRVAVKGVPIMPGFRMRKYALAMENEITTKQGYPESNTPAQLRKALEALITANTPINVSDNSMTSVSMVFTPEDCKIREIRPNEYVAYVSLREV
jgi:hypothetical protein